MTEDEMIKNSETVLNQSTAKTTVAGKL